MIWLTGLSAGLFYLSFPNVLAPRGIPFLAWGFLLPFLLAVENRSDRLKTWVGIVWGVLAYGLLFRWLLPVSAAGYVLYIAALALQGFIFAALLRSTPSDNEGGSGLFYVLYVPSLWVFSEYVRSFLLGGFTWALGYSLAPQPLLIQSAAFGGVYAVSWLIVVVNTALFLALKQKKVSSSLKYIVFMVAILLANYILGVRMTTTSVEEKRSSWRVGMLQADITRAEKKDVSLYDENVKRHIALIEASAAEQKPDLIVWPETAFPDDILSDLQWRWKMEELARRYQTDMLIGSALLRDGYDINAAVLLTQNGIWKDSYEKKYLVPFSEAAVRLPWLKSGARRLGLQGYHFLAGTKPPMLLLRHPVAAGGGGQKNALMGVAICSEEAYPSLFREMSRKGAAFAVVMLNDGWFEAPEALRLHAHTGILRAVETGLPVLRAANTGWTVGFNGHGQWIEPVSGKDLLLQHPGVMFIDVPHKAAVPFYARFGDIFAIICSVFVIIVLLLDVTGIGDPKRKARS